MFTSLRNAIMMLVALSAVTGVVYPLIVTGVGQLLFPRAANGSVLISNGRAVGSALIGQPFTHPKYFWSRPSATSPFAYNGTASTGSNLATTNPAFTEAVRQRIAQLRAADPDNPASVPIDLVTASGSGLDPHISPAAAIYQIRRVARARGVSVAEIERRVAEATQGRTFGVLGEPRVNVLELNLALDQK